MLRGGVILLNDLFLHLSRTIYSFSCVFIAGSARLFRYCIVSLVVWLNLIELTIQNLSLNNMFIYWTIINSLLKPTNSESKNLTIEFAVKIEIFMLLNSLSGLGFRVLTLESWSLYRCKDYFGRYLCKRRRFIIQGVNDFYQIIIVSHSIGRVRKVVYLRNFPCECYMVWGNIKGG